MGFNPGLCWKKIIIIIINIINTIIIKVHILNYEMERYLVTKLHIFNCATNAINIVFKPYLVLKHTRINVNQC